MDIIHPAQKKENLLIEEKKQVPVKESQVFREERPREKTKEEPKREQYEEHISEQRVERFEKEEIKRFTEEDKVVAIQKKKNKKRIAIAIILVLIGSTSAYVLAETLPRATIKIVTKKIEWSYIDSMVVSKQIASIDSTGKQIPGELFLERKNTTIRAEASGRKYVEKKARGKVIIYNAYSSTPQRLAVNTRFTTPDGKIFLLEKTLTVPGAKIEEGRILPSSIEATLVASITGAEYNSEKVSTFRIPGFLGTSKYQGFYATSEGPITGGLVGEIKFPTEENIRKAKETAIKEVRNAAEAFLALQIPQNFKIIEGSKQFTITKEEIGLEADSQGMFTVFEEGELAIMAFREEDITALMKILGIQNLQDEYAIARYTVEYGAGRFDVKNDKMSFALNFQGVFQKPIDKEGFVQTVRGNNEQELEKAINALPNVERATVSFWPKLFVRSVPKDAHRITVEVE